MPGKSERDNFAVSVEGKMMINCIYLFIFVLFKVFVYDL